MENSRSRRLLWEASPWKTSSRRLSKVRGYSHTLGLPVGARRPCAHTHTALGAKVVKVRSPRLGGQGRQLLMGRAPPRGSRRWFVQRSTDPCFGLNEPRETFRQLRPVTLIGSDWGWRNEVGTKGRATAAQRTSPQSRWEPRQSALAHPSPSRQECLVAALQKAWLEARGSLSLALLGAVGTGRPRLAPSHFRSSRLGSASAFAAPATAGPAWAFTHGVAPAPPSSARTSGARGRQGYPAGLVTAKH